MILNRKLQPTLNKIGEIQIPAIQSENLENGLPLSFINVGSQELVKLQISIPAGIIYQNKTLLAFFTNKILKEGSKNHSAAGIAQIMDYYGAYFETRITRDTAYFNLFCLNKYLGKVFPLVADMLVQPAFSNEEFLVLREQEKQSYQTKMKKVKNRAIREFNAHIFGNNHPYGSYAELSDYDQIKIEELKKFHQEHYGIQGWKLYISGYIEGNVKELIHRYFGNIPLTHSDVTSQIKDIQIPTVNPELFHTHQKGASQTAIKLGKICIHRSHPDYPALSLAQTVLGGYFGSRLMQNIREDKGYTYGISSSIQHFKHASVFSIGSEVGSAVAEAALKEVHTELKRLRTVTVEAEELNLVKNYMSGNLLKSLNGPFALGEMMRMLHEFHLPEDYYSQYTKAIQITTSEQVLQAAEKYLNEEQMTTVAVGGAFN